MRISWFWAAGGRRGRAAAGVGLAALLCLAAAPDLGEIPPSERAEKDVLKVRFGHRLLQRTDAPMPVDVRFLWGGERLLEGRLGMEFNDGNERLGSYAGPEVALSKGAQSYRWLLPSLPIEDGRELRATLDFRVRGGSPISLPGQGLQLPLVGRRSFVMAVSESRGSEYAALLPFIQALRFDRFPVQEEVEGRRTLAAVALYQAPIPPEEFPELPLAYAAYDVLVLPGDGFALLKERQTKAIQRWVEAGGSVFVLAGQSALAPHHLRFLNELKSGGVPVAPGTGAFSLAPDGTLREAGGVPGVGMRLLRACLGRAIVRAAPIRPGEDFHVPEWRKAVAFLWGVRADVAGRIEAKGQWPSLRGESVRGDEGLGTPCPMPLTPIQKVLFPKTVRHIPLGTIILVLSLFVLAIGPVDYFFLGWIRQRRLTWVLFPVLSISFTLFMVFLAERAMGGSDHRNAAVFVDLGPGGRVLRQDRYELVYLAREREVRTPLSGALFSGLSPEEEANEWDQRGWEDRETSRPTARTPVAFEGRYPGAYEARQWIPQWTSRMSRTLRLDSADAPADLSLDWDALEDAVRDPQAGPVFPEAWSRAAKVPASSADLYVFSSTGSGLAPWSWRAAFLLPEMSVRRACCHAPRGMFQWLFCVAPTGGGRAEDLPVMDPSEPGARLVVAVRRSGSDIFIYRRLFHVE